MGGGRTALATHHPHNLKKDCMRSIKILAGAVALAATAQAADAQTFPVIVEAHGAYAIPTGDWNDEDILDNGTGFGATAKVMLSPTGGVYAGWERYAFPIEVENAPGVEADATDEGFRAGVVLSSPIPSAKKLTPFVELGVTYNTLTIAASDASSSEELEAKPKAGAEVGVGAYVALHSRVSVVPVFRYRSYDSEFEDIEGKVSVGYFLFGVGLGLRL
jgi:hypothetical protein